MRIVADTHVHLYPCYDISLALDTLLAKLAAQIPEAESLAFMAERHDCNYFKALAEGKLDVGVEIDFTPDQQQALRMTSGSRSMHLFAGRQVITQERLEILAMTTDADIPDGLPAMRVVERILALGGLPVISWAPGKWFFKRGKLVQSLLDRYSPSTLFLGDSTLRPTFWSEPGLMRRAREKGYLILAGSDPLPFAGEERNLGRFATQLEGSFDFQRPVDSIRSLLRAPSSSMYTRHVGQRGAFLETLRRLYKNHQTKK
jgi:hypothetical protein